VLHNITLPEIKETELDTNRSSFIVEPLYPGYGMTLGNSMRRVLLSSLAGAAVTAVKIEGVSHEFSTIEGVREDIVEIILNLKQLRVNYHGDETEYLSLQKTGKGVVTAGDIKTPTSVEIVNPDLEICNLDAATSKIDLEIKIERGRGYVPVENRAGEKLPVGMIAVDAIYTPIRKVRYSVENTRVGQMTDLDKLILEVETDGSITPNEAVTQSAEILVGHFQVLAGHDVVAVGEEGVVTGQEANASQSDTILIDEVNFTPRTTNALMNNGIKTIGDLAEMTPSELKGLKGFGQKAYDEVISKLMELDVSQKEEV